MAKDIQKIELRNLELSDYLELKQSMTKAYPDWEDAAWTEKQIRSLLGKFPEGQLVILADGKVVGSALSLILNYDDFRDDESYMAVTGNYTFSTHNPNGDVLYGIDVFIHPDYRGLRLGRRLYDARKELCEQLNLQGILFGGRIPNYNKYSDELDPKQYIEKVRLKEIYDPVLSFQLSNDFHVRKILKGYTPEDVSSMEYAVLLEWNNIYYTHSQKLINLPKQSARIGLVQWQMRSFNRLEALFEQMEFFVDVVAGYKADFVLFPEMFNAPLLADFNHMPEADAIRELAEFTEPIRDKFQEFSIAYNTNIITGSMPYIKDGALVNVGFLCRRDGTQEVYEKLHITPNEASYWGMVGGNRLRSYNTDCGRIGILIGYDVEFPELSRLLADEGIQILFVPFHTNTQNEFTRMHFCARARAIENECYVAIAGSVGNLPKVNNMDIQVATSGVYTPADFSFPVTGTIAEANPNTEMTVIADVDLDLLKELHTYGSLRNLTDRRDDIYELRKK